MQLHLNNKQLLMIFSPFLVAAGVYIFSEEIISSATYIFPTYEEYSNKELSEKIDAYKKIEEKSALYSEIIEKSAQRDKNSRWIAETLFHEAPTTTPVVSPVEKTEVVQKYIEKTYRYKLEALYPNNKIAIINGSTFKEGDTLNDSKIIEIKKDAVLLENKKGSQWLYLFR